MKNKKTYSEELRELKEIYGHYNIMVVFATLKGYIDVRSYTSYKEVKEELNLIM